MTTSTLFSGLGSNQNAAGPPVPAATVVDAGAIITQAGFTLSVSPVTGWAEAAINWGPDGVNYPGQMSMVCAPGGTGSTTQTRQLHGAALSPASGGNDGGRYFKAELVTVSPGATATLTMTY